VLKLFAVKYPVIYTSVINVIRLERNFCVKPW